MSENKMTAFEPLAPAAETLADPRYALRDESQGRLILYCPRNNCGAVYWIDPGMWTMYCPIDLPSFIGSLADRGIALPEGPDLQTWMDAVSGGDIPQDRGKAN